MRALHRYHSALILLVGSFLAAGCSVQRAHTIPFDGRDNRGVVYSVPKTYLSVTVQYAYTRDDLHPTLPEAHLQGAMKVSPMLVPDEQSTFIIKTDGLMSNAMFLTSLNFRFNNGTLEAVDAATVDRTGEVIKELGDMAVNIAKAAAKGGDATPREKAILAAERHVDEIYAAIVQVTSQPDEPRRAETLKALTAELDATRKLIQDMRANVDPPIHTMLAPLTLMVDPDRPSRITPEYLEYEIKPPQLFPEVPVDNMDIIFVRIYDNQRRGFVDALHAGTRSNDWEGIIYRQPVPLLTKVVSGAQDDDERTEIFSGMVSYAQFAPPSVAVLDAKMLTSKHTSLTLDVVNGGILTYGNAQDSAVLNAAVAGAELSKAVLDAENASKPQPAGRGNAGSSTGRGGTSGTSGTGRGGSSSGGSSGSGGSSRGGTATQATTPPTTPPTTPATSPAPATTSQPTTRGGRGGGRGSTTLP